MEKTIRVRFAPSPTGYLHVGGLRTALYNYLFARQQGGVFLLRVEDTDRERYVKGSVESLLRVLHEFGLDPDEGPYLSEAGELEEKGPHGPYTQSERLDLYQKHAERLLDTGGAYLCFCSPERLEELHKTQVAHALPTRYDRACAALPSEVARERRAQGESCVIRLRVPPGETTFHDMLRGSITISHEEIDDQVLLKSDGFPTYHLAVVVDDHLMGITHVIRAEEWLPSTPKHVLLYQAFGWEAPIFAHLALILNPDHSKMSKRQGDVAVEDYVQKGFLPEALLNFVALLGFNPKGDQEIYTREELIELFDLSKVNKGGAIFDREKLLWMNKHYLRSLPGARIWEAVQPFFAAAGKGDLDVSFLQRVCEVERSRATLLTDVPLLLEPYELCPPFEPDLLCFKEMTRAEAESNLQALQTFLHSLPEETFEQLSLIEQALLRYTEQHGGKKGPWLWPLRVALSGQRVSASPFEFLWVLGKEASLKRLDHAITLLSS